MVDRPVVVMWVVSFAAGWLLLAVMEDTKCTGRANIPGFTLQGLRVADRGVDPQG